MSRVEISLWNLPRWKFHRKHVCDWTPVTGSLWVDCNYELIPIINLIRTRDLNNYRMFGFPALRLWLIGKMLTVYNEEAMVLFRQPPNFSVWSSFQENSQSSFSIDQIQPKINQLKEVYQTRLNFQSSRDNWMSNVDLLQQVAVIRWKARRSSVVTSVMKYFNEFRWLLIN